MQLTSKERSWLPWFGQNRKLALSRSCYANKSIYPIIEQTFEGIAATRVQLLKLWTNNHWDHLAAVTLILIHRRENLMQICLHSKY